MYYTWSASDTRVSIGWQETKAAPRSCRARQGGKCIFDRRADARHQRPVRFRTCALSAQPIRDREDGARAQDHSLSPAEQLGRKRFLRIRPTERKIQSWI